jgi:hypothetical protein
MSVMERYCTRITISLSHARRVRNFGGIMELLQRLYEYECEIRQAKRMLIT